jgi:hypothetical protein
MSAIQLLREPLDRALNSARRIADLSIATLNQGDCLDEIRRLRHDLPRLSSQTMASFGDDKLGASELQRDLDFVTVDAQEMASWIGTAWEELQIAYKSIGSAGNAGSASVRYGELRKKAFSECERKRRIIYHSCNLAFTAAHRICAAAHHVTRRTVLEGLMWPPAAELTAAERAIAIYLRDPTLSVSKVAEQAGCDRSLLYRDERFKRLRAAHQGTLPKGSKSKEGDLEAVEER